MLSTLAQLSHMCRNLIIGLNGPWPGPLQREAVEKARRKINGGANPHLARLPGVAVPSLLRNRAKRWGEKQIIQGFDRVFTQSGEWLGGEMHPLLEENRVIDICL